MNMPNPGYVGPDGIRFYRCCICQRDHRDGVDPEFHAHIAQQSRDGLRYRPPTIGERFAREMEAGDPKPLR